MFETVELLKKVRKLEIVTGKKVNDVLGGAYHSVFKGRGIEFDEVREYTFEDDVRDIDWNVSARLNAPFVKKYIEERELTVMLMVDISSSMNFGTPGRYVIERAVETAALLGMSALENSDRVGLALFDDQVKKFLMPRRGRHSKLRFIRELVAASDDLALRRTDLAKNITRVCQALSKRSVIFIISDLLNTSDELEKSLRIAARRHDCIVLNVFDPSAWQLPKEVRSVFDAESGSYLRFGSRRNQRDLAAVMSEHLSKQQQLCRRCGADLALLPCNEDLLSNLIGFFSRRKKYRSTTGGIR